MPSDPTPSSFTFSPTSLSFHAPPSLIRKRKRVDDKDNELPKHFGHTTSLISTSKKPKYSDNQQKLEDVFKAIDDATDVDRSHTGTKRRALKT
ncbi:hypothetical protein M378DRAFT_346291 [Amanita muscaria Koide BX008]|uniref:Uncharacterized protein n=1 Tax=Amanita muscaria (strain Koide BX008) TaxID=946122 RepID=A0A0C2S5P6_AMAMK|nr:hypothetical protein M378DRAFT_346291 [Amanita muscaria Koide BX008]